MCKNAFGKKLKQIRKSKGLTQERLAELAGVHEKHISKLETGVYFPTYSTLNKVLKALDLSIEDTGLDFEKVSLNDNPFYTKSIQILNNATAPELEFYYNLLAAGLKSCAVLKRDKPIPKTNV